MVRSARILLADDEEDFLKYTATLFENEGYECDCVTDGTSAVDMLRRQRYDAVISDIRMPGNPDLKLAREASAIQSDVAVIIVTAYPSTDTAIRAVELPVSAYIEKPVEFQDLLSRVHDAIIAARERREGLVCGTGDCRKAGWFYQVLSGVVDELRASKSAFKSRRLWRLRTRVETILKRLKSEMH